MNFPGKSCAYIDHTVFNNIGRIIVGITTAISAGDCDALMVIILSSLCKIHLI